MGEIIYFLILVNFFDCAKAAEHEPLNWQNAHTDLVYMSWRSNFLEQFRNMETHGVHEGLTEAARNQVLERFARGENHLSVNINPPHHSNVLNLFGDDYLDVSPLWPHVDLREVVKSGIIPLQSPYRYHSRDRRWTAGWILDTMDIVRQQQLTNTLFAGHGDLANNDLLKVLGLSGTFWSFDEASGAMVESFSGMIQPNQIAEGDTIDIISCFHGVWNELLDHLYFLPKGMDHTQPENFFQVQAIQVGGIGDFLDQAGVDALSEEWNNNEWGDVFNQNDYAIIRINSHAEIGENILRNILHARNLLHGTNVIRLRGEQIPDDEFHPSRIFAFGKPGHGFIQRYSEDENDFCLVSDVFNGNAITTEGLLINPLLIHPLRRVRNFQEAYSLNPAFNDEYVQPAPTLLVSKRAASIPLASGMSGGPVLKCEIGDAVHSHIYCRLLGVVHGSNLIQEAGRVHYKGLIAIRAE